MKKVRAVSFALVVGLILSYFSWHVIYGRWGTGHLQMRNAEIKALQAELDEIRRIRENLEKKVSHIRPESLNIDVADEQFRKITGFIGKGEFVIYLNKE